MVVKTEIVLLPEQVANENEYRHYLCKACSTSAASITGFNLLKRSIDARGKQVKYRLHFEVFINEPFSEKPVPQRAYKNVAIAKPILIAGCGPAGLFAAIRLIELGYKPILIERGKDVKSRRRDLADINKKGIVNPESNYCFGEGGAGTYSDGKLYTRSDKRGNVQRVLETFVEHGAEKNILKDAHPHIGTNKLPNIISSMRQQIIACGGEILFNTKLVDIISEQNNLKGIRVRNLINEAEYNLLSDALILATGHSARDIFELLQQKNILIEAKPFALGVRIEHPQTLIDRIQYHCENRGEFLPPSSYSLVHNEKDRGVYSFCMCPGGIIAPAATSHGEVVVNGWSPSKRNNPFANSGIVVGLSMNDFKQFEKSKELAALHYQHAVETKAFEAGGKTLAAPAQRMMDFVNKKKSTDLPVNSYMPGVNSIMLDDVLPKIISDALRNGLKVFGEKMKGYLTNEAILVGVESRTSSPVRIPREKESCMHTQIKGFFPCGEGAGYAGGIVSAAMDGERCAEKAVEFLK